MQIFSACFISTKLINFIHITYKIKNILIIVKTNPIIKCHSSLKILAIVLFSQSTL